MFLETPDVPVRKIGALAGYVVTSRISNRVTRALFLPRLLTGLRSQVGDLPPARETDNVLAAEFRQVLGRTQVLLLWSNMIRALRIVTLVEMGHGGTSLEFQS
jgi:hypothetical protein